MQQHLFKHFQSPGLTGFIEDVYILLLIRQTTIGDKL